MNQISVTLFAVVLGLCVTACGKKTESPEGPMESAGEEVDETAGDAAEGAEEAAEEAGEALEEAGDSAEDATQ